MSRLVFLFDLDSTITRQEMLSTIAEKVGCHKQMKELSKKNMAGEIPFKQSFLNKIELLRDVPVMRVKHIVSEMELNEDIVEFIKTNKSRCYVVTSHLDIWIDDLMKKIDMEKHFFSSKALIDRKGNLQEVFSILDKDAVVKQMILPFVAVGDGDNDAEMIQAASVGIGYGGVHPVGSSILECATHVVYDEKTLVHFLSKLI